MKKTAVFLLIILFLVNLSGCNYYYKGKHIELFTCAMYSIPDAKGMMWLGEVVRDPVIEVLEQDDYGRTLFYYCEDYNKRIYALVICQTYNETSVYFYPDVNYVLNYLKFDGEYNNKIAEKQRETFYLEKREKLKEDNDWNKPMELSKCLSCTIASNKDYQGEKNYISKELCNEMLNDYSETLDLANPDATPFYWQRVLQDDAEGKFLREIRGSHYNYDKSNGTVFNNNTYYEITLWVITDENGVYDKDHGILVMVSEPNNGSSKYIYDTDEIREFKRINNWKYDYYKP